MNVECINDSCDYRNRQIEARSRKSLQDNKLFLFLALIIFDLILPEYKHWRSFDRAETAQSTDIVLRMK